MFGSKACEFTISQLAKKKKYEGGSGIKTKEFEFYNGFVNFWPWDWGFFPFFLLFSVWIWEIFSHFPAFFPLSFVNISDLKVNRTLKRIRTWVFVVYITLVRESICAQTHHKIVCNLMHFHRGKNCWMKPLDMRMKMCRISISVSLTTRIR